MLEALWAIVLSLHCVVESVVVGYLAQILPVQVNVGAQQTVLDLARSIDEFKHRSSQYAELTYDEISEQFAAECNVQTLLRYVEDIECAACLLYGRHFPIEMYVKDSRSFKAAVWFDSHLGHDKVRLTVQHFFNLREQFVQNPTAPIDDLDCSSYPEKSLIFSQGLPAKPPTPSLVHRLFEERVRLSPDVIAVQYEQNAKYRSKD
ncbi:hypothetical protein PILCRDRAFT_13327 [Piloderma croceum F 1598]|uniref:Uncharacterized protein n=1 Tax=Piloderma croceum (strain F 1598) TaxID=765440 RepID=A0A0C3APJ6_PILCF|nr:hypothetical protein PILCRDRAFT_13327 [Piloderma croceum F 1598]